VLAILPPGNLKLRFFVPEAVLPQLAHGERVTVHCDGCADDISAKVSFISRTAEYTPPVIYSLQERSKLVFLIEAFPDDPSQLRVGQPIDVALGASAEPRARAAQRGGGESVPAQTEGRAPDQGLGSWLRNWALSLLGGNSKPSTNRN
jgi:HlyD family secretion protein